MESPSQKASDAGNVSISWRKRVRRGFVTQRDNKLGSQKNYPNSSSFATVTSHGHFGLSNTDNSTVCPTICLGQHPWPHQSPVPLALCDGNHQNSHYSVTHMGVSNNRHLNCLYNNYFRLTSKNTPKPAILVLCVGNPPVDSPHKGPVTGKRCHALTSPWLNTHENPQHIWWGIAYVEQEMFTSQMNNCLV